MTDSRLATQDWDAIVIGAGPAGSLIAKRLAQRGHSVLIIDKEDFPRPKVCGGCLGAIGSAALAEAGIELSRVGVESLPLSRVAIHSHGRVATLPLGDRHAVSRQCFDARLLDCAVTCGVEKITGSRAKLGRVHKERRLIEIINADGSRQTVGAQLVLLAAGLGAERLLPAKESPDSIRETRSRLGAGTTIPNAVPYGETGEVTMACGRDGEGYVGLAMIPGGRIDVAAALDPTAVRNAGGTATLAASILRQCDLAVPDGLLDVDWRSTPQLTQRPACLGAERVLLLGDAAGYVEPFTGEGIGWALRSALEAEPLAVRAITSWDATLVDAWTARHAATIGQWQRRCRHVCGLIGGRWATPWVVTALSAAPWIAQPVLRRIDPTI